MKNNINGIFLRCTKTQSKIKYVYVSIILTLSFFLAAFEANNTSGIKCMIHLGV